MANDRVKLVKQANDVVDVVGSYLALRKVGQTFKGLCPFHNDTRPSFDVDPVRQRYRCWSCGKHGDVLSFVQEHEKVSFREALELLARRAGLALDDPGYDAMAESRGQMLDVMRWATQQFHDCLLDSPLAEPARKYLGERGLLGETVRRWGLGYAPGSWQWLLDCARADNVSLPLLEKVGLIAARTNGEGFYDRFRDRVQFPIRDARGQTVGFGGRILPSASDDKGPKYYNSCDTPLFSKSDQFYGLDQARQTGEKVGYLAIVEGYTDVLMAHQLGVSQVVATMGTALNERHVRQLRRFVPRVVLVFDADAGGDTGVDRALEIFAGLDMDLSIASLPAGLDPCDLLVRDGAGPFARALECAVDALEYKLRQMLAREDANTIEGKRKIVDAVLGVIAKATPLPGQTAAVKMELMMTRIARRLALKEETLWARLDEFRRSRQAVEGPDSPSRRLRGGEPAGTPVEKARADPLERELLEALLAEPTRVGEAVASIAAEEVAHPGLRRLLQGLYDLHAAGEPATLDRLREEMHDHVPLVNKAFELQDRGLARSDRQAWVSGVLEQFRLRRERSLTQELQERLRGVEDHAKAIELLKRLQNRSHEIGSSPHASPSGKMSREDGPHSPGETRSPSPMNAPDNGATMLTPSPLGSGHEAREG